MEGFWNFLTVAVIVLGVVVIAFLVLFSLPKSKLRSYLLEWFGWGTTAAAAVSVISPIDMIPDFIPVLGQMDDLGALVVGICSMILAIYQRKQRGQFVRPAPRIVRVPSR